MHWFLDPITKHYADFSGRASRQEYWMFILLSLPVSFVLFFICGVFGALSVGSKSSLIGIVIAIIVFAAALFLPSLALAVRRLHDTGRSGWWLLLSFVPYIGSIVLLVFYCLPSQEGSNAYGSNPYGIQGMAAPTMTPTQPIGTAPVATSAAVEAVPQAQATEAAAEAPVVGYSNVTKEE